jgi:hypothetical protein
MSDAARLEALGEPSVGFCWRGHDLVIPRPLEAWPLDLIRSGRFVDAVVTLLDGQTAPIPRYGDVQALSDAMATAVGVERLPESPRVDGLVFGAVPLLLQLLDEYPDDIACDLRTFRGVDYADRWRGTLSLRQIWVYIRRLPPDSALAIARNGGHELWTKHTVLLAQLWERLAGQVYVGRPMTREEIAAATAKRAAAEADLDRLAAKQDFYSPEATRARIEAAKARKAAVVSGLASAPAAAGRAGEAPPAALSALDKAVAARHRELARKAG